MSSLRGFVPKYFVDEMIELAEKEKKDSNKTNVIFAQKLKILIKACDEKLDSLLDVHLEKALSRDEYTVKKNKVLSQKMDLEQKLKDSERRGSGRFELSKTFFSLCNEAENVALDKNLFKKVDFLKKLGSNRIIADRKLKMELNQPWGFVYETKEKARLCAGGIKTENALEEGDFHQLISKSGGLGFEPR